MTLRFGKKDEGNRADPPETSAVFDQAAELHPVAETGIEPAAPQFDEPEPEPEPGQPWAPEQLRGDVSQPGPPVITVEYEAIAGSGEDSPPLVHIGPGNSLALGVFDGLGGAGGARYAVEGTERTGAFIASRLARAVAAAGARMMLAPEPAQTDEETARTGEWFAAQFEEELTRRFGEKAESLGGPPSQIRSSLVRTLPTTVALVLAWPEIDAAVAPHEWTHRATAVWAGDSRVYLLQPESGLVQVTIDDTRAPGDAMASLVSDPPMSNCVSASDPFHLNRFMWSFTGLGVLVAATDGCFGYVSTPAHFEFELVDTLMQATTVSEWKAQLSGRLAAITRDDATLAAAVIAPSFEALREALAPRHDVLLRGFIEPYRHRDEAVREAEGVVAEARTLLERRAAARREYGDELWSRYRGDYEKLIPPHRSD